MLLLAIDLYGIQPFQQPTRIPLKPNLNLITGANGAGKTTVFHTLSALLLNTSLQGITLQENHPAQAAVIFQAKDGGVYRIAADFLKGIRNLSKLDPSGKGTILEKDPAKIRLWVQKELSGLEEDEVSSLFMIDRSRLPSMRALRKGNSAPESPSASVPPGRSNRLSSEGKAAKEKKLKELQKRLEEISQYEQESLSINDKASEIRHRIEEIRSIGLRIAQLHEAEEKKYAALAGIEKVSPDLLKRYEEGIQNRQNELAELEEEKVIVENELAGIGEIDPIKDRPLQIGVGVTAISFLLPLFITLQGPFRYIFLIGILGGLGMAVKAYLHLNRRSAVKAGLQKKRIGFNEKLHHIDKKFDKEHKEVIDLLKKLGVKEVAELKGLQRAYLNHARSMQEAASKRQGLLKDDSIEGLESQQHELEKKAKGLEGKLRENEGLTQEIYRLQDEVRSASDDMEASVDLEASLPAFSLGAERWAASSESLSPLPFLPRALAIGKQRGIPLPLDQIKEQIGILSSLFSPDKKAEISLTELGEITFGQVGLDHLSSGTADRLFFCIALPTWDRFASVPFPLVLDDPLINLDPKHQEVALELLRGISKKRQVLLFTFSPFAPINGDHRFQLSGGS